MQPAANTAAQVEAMRAKIFDDLASVEVVAQLGPADK